MVEKLSTACIHVLRSERPVRYIRKDAGELALACGYDDHDPDSLDDWGGAHAFHFTDADPSLGIIRELAENDSAYRQRVGDPWLRLSVGRG